MLLPSPANPRKIVRDGDFFNFHFSGDSRRGHRDGTTISCGKPRIATDGRTDRTGPGVRGCAPDGCWMAAGIPIRCVCVCVCLCLYLSIYLSICMSVCMSLCVCVCVCVSSVSLYLYICLSVCLSLCVCVCVSSVCVCVFCVSLSIYLSVCLSFCVYVCVCVSAVGRGAIICDSVR